MDDYPTIEFTFPTGLDKDEAINSTKSFAYSLFQLDIQGKITQREENQSLKRLSDKLCNPILFKLAEVYPLPLSYHAIGLCYAQNSWVLSPEGYMPRPLVESHGDYAGLVKKAENEDATGWFIGLVEDVNKQKMQKLIDSGEQNPTLLMELFDTNKYRFKEGMFLLEGKLNESVIRQLKDYEKFYNKNILGKVITGRPRSDPEYWLEPARAKLREKPDITQDDLAYEIGCDLKTFKINRKNGGFATFKEFKDSILKP